jgi:hypothetical protein
MGRDILPRHDLIQHGADGNRHRKTAIHIGETVRRIGTYGKGRASALYRYDLV